MAHGATTARVKLVDEDGNDISDTFPLQVDSAGLKDSIDSLADEVRRLRELVELIIG